MGRKTSSATPPRHSSSASTHPFNYHYHGLAETQSNVDILGPLASGPEERVNSLLVDPEATPTRQSNRTVTPSASADSMDSIYLRQAGNLLQPPLPRSSPEPNYARHSSPPSEPGHQGGSSPFSGRGQSQHYPRGPYDDDSMDYDDQGHGQPDDFDPYEEVKMASMSTERSCGDKSISSMGDLDDERPPDLPPRTPRSLMQHYYPAEEEYHPTQVSDVPTQIIDAPSHLGTQSQDEDVSTQLVDAPSHLGVASHQFMDPSTQQESVPTQELDSSPLLERDAQPEMEDVPTQLVESSLHPETEVQSEVEDVPTQLVDEPTQLLVSCKTLTRHHPKVVSTLSSLNNTHPRQPSPPPPLRPIKELIPWLRDSNDPASPSSTAPEASTSQSARSFSPTSAPRHESAGASGEAGSLLNPASRVAQDQKIPQVEPPSSKTRPVHASKLPSKKSSPTSATRSLKKRRRSPSTDVVPESEEENNPMDGHASEDDVPLSKLRLPTRQKVKQVNNDGGPKRRKVVVNEEEEEAESSENELSTSIHDVPPTTTGSKKRTPRAGSSTSKKSRSTSKAAKVISAGPQSTGSKPSRNPRSSKRSTPAIHRSSPTSSHLSSVTAVFALWREDGFYYHGLVTEALDTGRFKILFDDNQHDIVHIDQMRMNDLRPEDEVYVDNGPFRVLRTEGDTVYLDSHSGRAWCGLGALRIPSNTVAKRWADRRIDPDQVKPRPTLARPRAASLVSTSSKNCPLFRGYGFIITKAVPKSNKQSTAELEELDVDAVQRHIRSNGGTVVDDWSSVITFEGQYSSPHCWVLNRSECQWQGDDIDKIFLVSNDHCTKPKFLTAIALAVPCVDVDFIHHSVRDGYLHEWRDHLLEQGTSVFGDHSLRITQTVSLNWCMSSDDVLSIMDNAVARMLLCGKKILCHGSDFVKPSSSKPRRDDTTTNGSFVMIPPIFAAMGADEVVAARSQADTARPTSYFDYIVVKSPNDKDKLDADCHGKVVSFGWVKNSLILGRLLPDKYKLIP